MCLQSSGVRGQLRGQGMWFSHLEWLPSLGIDATLKINHFNYARESSLREQMPRSMKLTQDPSKWRIRGILSCKPNRIGPRIEDTVVIKSQASCYLENMRYHLVLTLYL